jgi:hypothetical protein
MRRIAIALAGVVVVLATAAPAIAAATVPVAPGAGCSSAYLDADYRLGPATTPDRGYLIVGGQPVEFPVTLKPGQSIDRYGSLYGSFLAPFGTSYAARSIPPSSLDDAPGFSCNYHTYKVAKAFAVEAGPIAPA